MIYGVLFKLTELNNLLLLYFTQKNKKYIGYILKRLQRKERPTVIVLKYYYRNTKQIRNLRKIRKRKQQTKRLFSYA